MTAELDPGFEPLPEPKRPKRGRLLGSLVAVVVLAGGGVATYVAFAAGDSGSGSPKEAVQRVIDDVQHADLLGLLDDLVPNERSALSGAVQNDIAALKRLNILRADASPSKITGIQFAAHDLKYGKPVKVNDNVQIVSITGGTVDLNANVAQLPLTQRLLGRTHASGNSSEHHRITQPVRIAAQRSGGRWYASLFYTIADGAAHHFVPPASNAIPAIGAGTPADAVQFFVHALFAGDTRSAIGYISPSELPAIHDYGVLVEDALARDSSSKIKLQSLNLTTANIKNGVRVSIHDLTLSIAGHSVRVQINRGCLKVSSGVINQQVCAGDAADVIGRLFGNVACSSGFRIGSGATPTPNFPHCTAPKFTAAQKSAIGDLITGLTKLGIDTDQEDGKWYITPIRTLGEATTTMLGSLKGDDLYSLMTL